MHRFRSRVSVFLLLLLIASVAPAFFLEEPDNAFWAYLVLFGSIGLVVVLLFATHYVITEDELVIKYGPFTYSKFKLKAIEKVKRSYNPLSSPAASLKRLHIISKNKSVLISPADEQAFLRMLKSRNQDILTKVSDDDDWWRFWNWDI